MAAFVAGTIKAIIPLDAAGSLLARRDIEEDDWWLLDELYRSHAGTGKQTPQTLLDQIDYQRKLVLYDARELGARVLTVSVEPI